MTEKLTNICEQFDRCKFSDITIVKEKFCYRGGDCPETYYPIIKRLIKANLILHKSE